MRALRILPFVALDLEEKVVFLPRRLLLRGARFALEKKGLYFPKEFVQVDFMEQHRGLESDSLSRVVIFKHPWLAMVRVGILSFGDFFDRPEKILSQISPRKSIQFGCSNSSETPDFRIFAKT